MYLLQRNDGSLVWDIVPLYVYENWDKCMGRYNGNRCSVCHGQIFIHTLTPLSYKDMAILNRVIGAKDAYYPVSSNGGFIKEPETIKMKIRNSIRLYETSSGAMYKSTGSPGCSPVDKKEKIKELNVLSTTVA